jgi:hypothetical protein
MTGLDLRGIDNTGEIYPTVAFAQRGAELIQHGELCVAELDFETGGAFDEGAQLDLPKTSSFIRII